MVIARYITKEVSESFVALTLILLFIAISNKFVVYLAKAAAGKLPVAMLFKVIALYIPELFGMLAPIAIFTAILFTHSRLHAESEVTVLLTSGFDWWRLTKATAIFVLVVTIFVATINLVFAPLIIAKREQIVDQGQAIGILYAITPGQIQMIDENADLVFYVEDIQDDVLKNIFIADSEHKLIITAQHALIKQMDHQNEFYLILKNGYRYVGTPGTANYQVISFAEYGRELKFDVTPSQDVESVRSTRELLSSKDRGDQAELQWRLAMPIAVLILALLAIPLAKVQPRQGRFAKFLPAAVIYMMYYNTLTVVKRWIVTGDIPVYPGLWAVHLAFFMLAIVLYLHVSGRWHEYFRSLFR